VRTRILVRLMLPVTHSIVRCLHLCKLLFNYGLNIRRKTFCQRLAITLHCRVFTRFTFIDNGFVRPLADCFFKANPATMETTGNAAGSFSLFTQAINDVLKFARICFSLTCILRKERFQGRVFCVRSRLFKTFVSFLVCLDEIV
jgi:hypothetical protein